MSKRVNVFRIEKAPGVSMRCFDRDCWRNAFYRLDKHPICLYCGLEHDMPMTGLTEIVYDIAEVAEPGDRVYPDMPGDGTGVWETR